MLIYTNCVWWRSSVLVVTGRDGQGEVSAAMLNVEPKRVADYKLGKCPRLRLDRTPA